MSRFTVNIESVNQCVARCLIHCIIFKRLFFCTIDTCSTFESVKLSTCIYFTGFTQFLGGHPLTTAVLNCECFLVRILNCECFLVRIIVGNIFWGILVHVLVINNTHRLRLHSTVPDPRKIYAPADFTM
jgi:hypothetical protein